MIIVKLPATAFNNEAMALVLRVMWRRHIRRYFFIDSIVFLVFVCLWILLTEKTSSTTSVSIGIQSGERLTCALVLGMNSLFAAKEAIQSDFGRRPGYLRSIWNWVDLLSIPCVYAYGFVTLFSSEVVPRLIPLAVAINFLMTGVSPASFVLSDSKRERRSLPFIASVLNRSFSRTYVDLTKLDG